MKLSFLYNSNWNYLFIILIAAASIGVFTSLYLINKKIKPPKDCPKDTIGCQCCMLSCSARESNFTISGYSKFDPKKKYPIKLEKVKPLKKDVYLKESEEYMNSVTKYLDKKKNIGE